MRRFVNLYLVLFLVDAGLSLVVELLAIAGTPVSFLSAPSYAVSGTVLVLSAALYAGMGIDRRLPKGLLLPLTLYVSWRALEMWPLSGVFGRESIGLVAAAGQASLGGLVILLRGLGGQVLLTAQQFRGPTFSWRNTFGFTLANLLLMPLALVFSGLAVADYFLEEHTAGFLRLSPVGIYLSERSYHRDHQVIRLAGMMHIGREAYYRDLVGSMPSGEAIILAEGVTDRDRLLASPFNYSRLARVIGLSSQEAMQLDGHLVDLNALDKLPPMAGAAGKPDIARADLDLNRFDPKTIEFLNVLGNTLLSARPLAEALTDYNAWAQQNMTPERVAGIMTDILDKRNAAVIGNMLRTLKYYDTIIIPWGAMHMPAIEAAVLAQGFRLGSAQERLALDFRTIPYLELLRNWSSATAGQGSQADLPGTFSQGDS